MGARGYPAYWAAIAVALSMTRGTHFFSFLSCNR